MRVPNSYLFTAYYDIGNGNVEQYEQGSDDRSMLEPEDPKRNAFYDIWYAEPPVRPKEQLYAFRLAAIDGVETPEGVARVIGVNLLTGLFEADGAQFLLHDHLKDDYNQIGPMRLIYFRNVAQMKKAVFNTDSGEQVGERLGYQLGYLLGWQAVVTKHFKRRSMQKFISIPGLPVWQN